MAAPDFKVAPTVLGKAVLPLGGAYGVLPKTGLYYFPSNYITGANVATVLSEMRAAPLFLGKAATLDRIAWRNSSSVTGALFRIGIYNDDGGGYPGSLLLDAGTVDCSTAGVHEITISQAVAAGLYWLVGVPQTSICNGQIMNGSGTAFNAGGYEINSWAATDPSLGWAQSSVTGALPSNFTTTKTRTTQPYVVAVRAA